MKISKKYKVIAKVGSEKFVKYNVNNLLKFTAFLDSEYLGWRWFNVYLYNKEGNGNQIGSFSNKTRPKTPLI